MQSQLQQLRGLVHFMHSGIDTASRKTEDTYLTLTLTATPAALLDSVPLVGGLARQSYSLNETITKGLHEHLRGVNRNVENAVDDLIGGAQAYFD